MTNSEIAAIFRELADLLVQKKENWFKIRSYRKAADEIDKLPIEISVLSNENRLREIPGIGDAIEKKITEILTTGKLELIQRLKSDIVEHKIEKSRS